MNGVYRSDDNGNSWVRVDSGFTDAFVNTITTLGAYLFAGTDDGVYKSSDLGATWQYASNGITGGSVHTMTSLGRTEVFAGTNDGVFVSTDQGDNWVSITNDLSPTMFMHLESTAIKCLRL